MLKFLHGNGIILNTGILCASGASHAGVPAARGRQRPPRPLSPLPPLWDCAHPQPGGSRDPAASLQRGPRWDPGTRLARQTQQHGWGRDSTARCSAGVMLSCPSRSGAGRRWRRATEDPGPGEGRPPRQPAGKPSSPGLRPLVPSTVTALKLTLLLNERR